MDHKIYDLLNDVEMDLDEYEEKELSSEEKQKIENRLLQEVRTMNKQEERDTEKQGTKNRKAQNMKAGKEKKGNRKTGRKIEGIAAAACVAVSAIAIGSNPVAAKALLNNLYEKIIAGSEDEKNADEIKEIYTKIGEESVPAESVRAESAGEEVILEAEDAGVKLRVCDIFCDGYKLYYTLELETDNEILIAEEVDGVFSDVVSTKEEQTCEVWVGGENESSPFSFRKQADGTFTSVQDYDFFATLMPKNYENGDIVPVEIRLKRFEGVDYDNHDETGEYVYTEVVEGEWRLSFPVTVDTSANVVTEINKEDNGVRLVNAVRTKATVNLTIEAPDFSKAPYNDPYNDPEIGIKDAAGNWMTMLGCYDGIKDDGTHVYQITLLDNGEKEFYLEVTEKKNEDAKQIAGIAFQVE